MGRDAKTGGKAYNSLEQHILRSLGQFEQWLLDAYRARSGKAPAAAKATGRKQEREKWEQAPKGRQRINPETMQPVLPKTSEEEEVPLR